LIVTASLLVLLASPFATRTDADDKAKTRPLVVDVNFANGHGHVEVLDQKTRTIHLSPVEMPQRGWACWWYFRVSGIDPGETLTISVGKFPWATPSRAAFSLDNHNWSQTNAGVRDGNRFVYQQRIDAAEAWFAWGPPFTVDDATALTEWAAANIPQTKSFELGRTRSEKSIPAIHVGGPRSDVAAEPTRSEKRPLNKSGTETIRPPHMIWIQARQHAWEAGSSWVCKGLVNWLASDDPSAYSLRTASHLIIVPIMDVDSVSRGTGGKNQHPWDHNRDWTDQPHWPAVQAATEKIRELDGAGRFDVFIDLHNPGPNDESPFFFVSPRSLLSDQGRRNLSRLLATSRVEITGPLTFLGEHRESGPAYDEDWRNISKNWVSFNTREHVVAVTLETTWNSPNSTIHGYERVGQQLGRALERYLRTDPRAKP